MPRRSRGCAECRQRRIGCDGGAPCCRQCQVTNRQCSGPLQGAVIINQTKRIVSRHQRPRPDVAVRRECLLTPQPSHQSIFAHAFIAEFVSFITARNEQARRQSWLTEIQRGSIVDEGLAIDLSMQATALAYCGAASNNPAAVREACRIYGTALSKHSRSIAHDSTSLRAASLYTCVMLSLFEAICSTSSVAYGTHLRAAQKMLALVPREDGPGLHAQVISQLGQHVQCQTLFTMLATPQEYIRQAPVPASWAKAPGPRDAFDRLIHCLYYLTDTLVRRHHEPDLELFVDANVSLEIEELWDGFQEQAVHSGERIQWPMEPGSQYQDPFTAMALAYFAASRVLLSILGIESPRSGPQVSTFQNACDCIIECCRFFEGKEIGCAHLRMFFPLMLVAMHGGSEQQDVARRVLGQRLGSTAFKGLGFVAVRRVQQTDFVCAAAPMVRGIKAI
ncbi:hypothetical protein B0T10DRAFT_99717 [Thelonectria olida]|uniref:Zn(2)-C6 fungal-type domain-containing protein n=1 Tax=Thelonectria olida TaxID=1576542 RepID=A0A9P8WHG6_9HYPO|nr:hypothetical protein B0T10DRAFT_99717 [Thelonectria olida]